MIIKFFWTLMMHNMHVDIAIKFAWHYLNVDHGLNIDAIGLDRDIQFDHCMPHTIKFVWQCMP